MRSLTPPTDTTSKWRNFRFIPVLVCVDHALIERLDQHSKDTRCLYYRDEEEDMMEEHMCTNRAICTMEEIAGWRVRLDRPIVCYRETPREERDRNYRRTCIKHICACEADLIEKVSPKSITILGR